jgi:glycine/D-amino acid oxidase-like deaminating enzyme
VTTANGDKYLTKKLILSVGAWAPELYGHLIKVPLHCERRVLFWFEPPNGVD